MGRTRLKFQENEEKLKQLILYVSQKYAGDSGFGSTKLNKILYFSDFIFYASTGKPITGVTYQRLPYGPAPRRMKPVSMEMINNSQLAMQEVHGEFRYVTKKPVNLVSPELDKHFSAEEIATVDEVIDYFRKSTASAISQFSHDWGGWKYAHDGETIPYESAFIDNSPLTKEEHSRGLEIAKNHELLDW